MFLNLKQITGASVKKSFFFNMNSTPNWKQLTKDLDFKVSYGTLGSCIPGVQVTTVEQYFSWLNTTAFPALFYELYDNQSRRTWSDRFFIRDLQNVRVGPPRVRQVRTSHGKTSNL